MAFPGLEHAIRRFLNEQHSAHDVEVRNGEIVVVSPHDFVSSNVVLRLAGRMSAFADEHRLGFVVESNAGFRYADGDLLAPDIAFISRERLPVAPRSFASAVPELVIEVQSSTQRPRAVRDKLALLLEKGSAVGAYVDPDRRVVEIFRPRAATLVVRDGDILRFDDVLPGWEMAVSDLWPTAY